MAVVVFFGNGEADLIQYLAVSVGKIHLSNTISLDFGVMSAPFSSIAGVSSIEFAVSIERQHLQQRAIFPAFSKSLNTMKEAITKIRP